MHNVPLQMCSHLGACMFSMQRRAERGNGGFWSGFVVGGVVCGALGFIFAPQVGAAWQRWWGHCQDAIELLELLLQSSGQCNLSSAMPSQLRTALPARIHNRL